VIRAAGAPQYRSSADSCACAGSGQPFAIGPWIALQCVRVTAPGQAAEMRAQRGGATPRSSGLDNLIT
jgi:hypothetical protein